MTNDSNDSLESKLLEDVLATGFPTEVVAASTLEELGWYSTLGSSYVDPHTGQSREFDLRSYKTVGGRFDDDSAQKFGVNLMIECKKSNKPWVIFCHDNQGEISEERMHHPYINFVNAQRDGFWTASVYDTYTAEGPQIGKGSLRAYHHYFQSRRWGHNYYEAFRNREKADHSTQIYTAINSVVNATRFAVDNFGPVTVNWRPVFYPVIVVEGLLYEADVKSIDKVDLTPKDHIILKHHVSYPPDNPRNSAKARSFLIDIVRLQALGEFAKTVVAGHEELIRGVNRRR